ncbi:MAG: prefoldin subunit beta [Thermoplasmatota archaeon]
MAMSDQELQEQIRQLQSMQGQLQAAAQQRQQFEALKAENERALDALGDVADDAPVYRNVGSLLVQEAGKAAVESRIKDDLETLEIRIKRLAGQEEQLRASASGLQAKLEAALMQREGAGSAPAGA